MKSAVKKGKKKLTKVDRHNKIRVPLYGLPPWVAEENAVAFKEAMEKIRKRRKGGWPIEAWRSTVNEELRAKWGGSSRGGKRIPCVSNTVVRRRPASLERSCHDEYFGGQRRFLNLYNVGQRRFFIPCDGHAISSSSWGK